MTLMDDSLKQSLGIPLTLPGDDDELLSENSNEGMPVVKLEIKDMESEISKDTGSDTVKDYHHARNLTYTLLEMTGDALAGSLEVAKQSEHPRAYGVFNELAITMRGLTQDLLALQKSYKEVTKDRPDLQPAAATTINAQINNFGATTPGSTTDIIKMMSEQNAILNASKVIDEDDLIETFDNGN